MPNDGKLDPFDMLYHARWNIPQAAEAMGWKPCEENWEELKKVFKEWAVSRPLQDWAKDL